MIFAFFNILLVFTESKSSTASSSASSSVAIANSSKAPSTSTLKSTAVNTVSSTSVVVAQKTSTSTLNGKEICVQCYDKEIRTPDCKECNCECKCDNNKKTTFKKSDSSDGACPKVDMSQVPCECKENGKIRVDKSYKPKPDSDLALGVSN